MGSLFKIQWGWTCLLHHGRLYAQGPTPCLVSFFCGYNYGDSFGCCAIILIVYQVLGLRGDIVCYFNRDLEANITVVGEAVVGALCLIRRWDCVLGSAGYFQEGDRGLGGVITSL